MPDDVAATVVKNIVGAFPEVERVILCGSRACGSSMDFLVRTPEEVREGFPFFADDIVREGRLLYERPR